MTPIPLLYSPQHQGHAPRVEFYHGNLLDYPEVPARVEALKNHLTQADLAEVIEITTPLPREAILRVHDADMVDYLEDVCSRVEARAQAQASFYQAGAGEPYLYPGVFAARPYMARLKESKRGRHGYYFFDTEGAVGANTWNAALHAATLAYEGANRIMQGYDAQKSGSALADEDVNRTMQETARIVYALCRPPGHHAGPDFMGGYCYLNNAAIAAAHLMNMGKVALIDVDYHHGNGSQAIFWNEPNVLFGSLHGHPDDEYPFYAGYQDETGGPDAPNTNFNFPLPAGTTADAYLAALDALLERVAGFQPAALVVSLGFDAFAEDPLSTFQVTREAYYKMGAAMIRLGLPVLLVQEGGYQVQVLGHLAEQLILGMLGR